jgi:hypothetical protein
MTTVLRAAILSAVGSVAMGTMSKGLNASFRNTGLCTDSGGRLLSTGVRVGRWCGFRELILVYFVRLLGTGVEE